MGQTIPYLKLDPHVEEAIRADRAAGWKNPCAFDDAQVTRREPNPHDEATLARPAFARDIERSSTCRPTTATPTRRRCSRSWRTMTSAGGACTCSW